MYDRAESIDISVIISANNEESNVGLLYQGLTAVLESTARMYEMIFVDDGSTDNTYAELFEISRNDKRVNILQLEKSYGQVCGLIAGINCARGAIVITMDGDLQHKPADVLRLLEKIDEGYTVVNGRKIVRTDSFFFRTLPAYITKKMISFLLGGAIFDVNSTFRGYRREVLKDIISHGEILRFAPLLLREKMNIAEIDIETGPRRFGRTHFDFFRRVIRMMKDVRLLFLVRNEVAIMKEAEMKYSISRRSFQP